MDVQPVKGCDDWYPQEFAEREAIFASLRRVARRYSYREVSTPALETVELLTRKSGEEIKQQLFVLEKKCSEYLAMRPELTPGVTRMVCAKQKGIVKPIKWFSLDRMWRYEAPQKGRSREFYQLSVEQFGAATPESDAEVMNLCLDCFRSFGLTEKDILLKLNNRKLLSGMIASAAGREEVEDIIRIVDKQAKVKADEFIEMLLDAGLDQEQADKVAAFASLKGSASEVLKTLGSMTLSGEAKKGLDEMQAVLALLPQEYVIIDLSLARGLAYYTGNVFEVFDRQGELRALAGGGRYDQLVELLGGEKEPATGFAIGSVTLGLLLRKKNLVPQVDVVPDYYVANVGVDDLAFAKSIAAKLRRNGLSVETDLMSRKLDKQLKYANAVGAKKLIVIGRNERETGIFKVKDMDSGKEEESSVDSL